METYSKIKNNNKTNHTIVNKKNNRPFFTLVTVVFSSLCFRTTEIVVYLTFLVAIATSYPRYKDKIPNGDRVPSPCDQNVTWGGVGHLLVDGGGSRNQFGIDFANAGKVGYNIVVPDTDMV